MLLAVNTGQARQRHAHAEGNIGEADTLLSSFVTPPDSAKPRVYWWWLFNRVDKQGSPRLEEFKAKGISGVEPICTGGYAGETAARRRVRAPMAGALPPRGQGSHAAKIELGFNLRPAAG